MLGLLSILLLLLAGGLDFYGDMQLFNTYIEEYESTAYEKRAAVAEAYRQSWGIDGWRVASFICAAAAIASGVAAFKLPKNKSSETI